MTRRFRLVLSGACALLATTLCLAYGQHVRDEAERVRAEALERYGGEVVSLLVAPDGLEAGEVVDRRNVIERDWLADLAPEGAIVGMESVEGEEVTIPAAPGAPLTTLNFRDSEDAVEVPAGHVALAVPVTDDLGLPPSAAEGTELVAYRVSDTGVSLIAPEVQVLRAPSDQGGIGSRGSVTLAVEPTNVPSVLASGADGSLRLALPAPDVAGEDAGATAPVDVPAEGSSDEAAGAGSEGEGDAS